MDIPAAAISAPGLMGDSNQNSGRIPEIWKYVLAPGLHVIPSEIDAIHIQLNQLWSLITIEFAFCKRDLTIWWTIKIRMTKKNYKAISLKITCDGVNWASKNYKEWQIQSLKKK